MVIELAEDVVSKIRPALAVIVSKNNQAAGRPIVGTRSSRSTRTAAARPARCGNGTVTIRNALMIRWTVARSRFFACIGPALEIFSRYVKVETADGLA